MENIPDSPLLSIGIPSFSLRTIFLILLQNDRKLLKRSSQNTTGFIFLKIFVFSMKKIFLPLMRFCAAKKLQTLRSAQK